MERSASLVRSRIAVSVVFAINGFIYANWTSRLPRLQQLYAMDNGETGFVLTAMAAGALVAMPLAGFLIVRNGSRRLTIYSTVLFAAALPAIAFLPAYWALLAYMPLIGIATGVMDVAMNAQAVDIEKSWGRPITSSFHACFSAGMFLGAGSAALFIASGLDLGSHVVTVGIITLVLAGIFLRYLLADREAAVEPGGSTSSTHFSKAIVVLGVAALCTMITEGSMADWTPLYMTRVTGSPESLAPLGQAAFSGAMLVGRALGDFLRARLGSVRVVQGGALLAMLGLVAAIVYPTPLIAIVGFACVGLGLANIVPVVFSAASNIAGLKPGVGISSVSTIAYAAFLVGPPVIGFVSDYQNARLPEGMAFFPGIEGLRVGLGVVVGLLLVLWWISVLVLPGTAHD